MNRAEGHGLRKAGLQGCGYGDCRSGPLAERLTVIMPSELVDGIGRFTTAALGLANWAEVLPRGSLVVSDPAIDKEAAGVPRFCRRSHSCAEITTTTGSPTDWSTQGGHVNFTSL